MSLIVVGGLVFQAFRPPSPMKAAFTTNLIDRSSAPISHGETSEVVLKLQNHGQGRIRLETVRFSQPFVHLSKKVSLPQWISAGTTASVPVEIVAEDSHWGPQEIQVTAVVTNGRESSELQTFVLCDIAAHINPAPALVQFPRVKRSDSVPPLSLRLWYAHGNTPPEGIQVESLDPAIQVTTTVIDNVQNGRHYVLELTIKIDAGQAQPHHRSQIVVRANGSGPPVIIPVVGWVDE